MSRETHSAGHVPALLESAPAVSLSGAPRAVSFLLLALGASDIPSSTTKPRPPRRGLMAQAAERVIARIERPR